MDQCGTCQLDLPDVQIRVLEIGKGIEVLGVFCSLTHLQIWCNGLKDQ